MLKNLLKLLLKKKVKFSIQNGLKRCNSVYKMVKFSIQKVKFSIQTVTQVIGQMYHFCNNWITDYNSYNKGVLVYAPFITFFYFIKVSYTNDATKDLTKAPTHSYSHTSTVRQCDALTSTQTQHALIHANVEELSTKVSHALVRVRECAFLLQSSYLNTYTPYLI